MLHAKRQTKFAPVAQNQAKMGLCFFFKGQGEPLPPPPRIAGVVLCGFLTLVPSATSTLASPFLLLGFTLTSDPMMSVKKYFQATPDVYFRGVKQRPRQPCVNQPFYFPESGRCAHEFLWCPEHLQSTTGGARS